MPRGARGGVHRHWLRILRSRLESSATKAFKFLTSSVMSRTRPPLHDFRGMLLDLFTSEMEGRFDFKHDWLSATVLWHCQACQNYNFHGVDAL